MNPDDLTPDCPLITVILTPAEYAALKRIAAAHNRRVNRPGAAKPEDVAGALLGHAIMTHEDAKHEPA